MQHNFAEKQCSLCGEPGPFPPFFEGASLRECRCPGCGSSRRTRDLARVLMREFLPASFFASVPEPVLAACLKEFRPLRIYELQAQGPLHELLKELPGYCCSEYLQDTPPGERDARGILCQDVTRLTFDENLFDAVISQDVMEHVEDAWKGFAQVQRVLRPGGKHLFTVPLHEGMKTRCRAKLAAAGNLEHILLPVHHKDPLDPAGALVFWDYGDDLPELLSKAGLATRKALHVPFYGPEMLCNVADAESHARCMAACAKGAHVSFFIYNSVVFVTEKKR